MRPLVIIEGNDLLAAINVIRTLNSTGARRVPADAPTAFIRPRWKPLLFTDSGLDLLTAAIVLWNTVYLDRTITTLNKDGNATDPDLLQFLSPLGWEHTNLTGDYTWPRANQVKPGKYRPLRRAAKP